MMILAWTAWLGIYFVIQGIYVGKRGVVAPLFFEKVTQPLPTLSKLITGLFHIACGLWLISFAGKSVWHNRGNVDGGSLVPAAAMIAGGILAIVWPITPLGWAKRAHPDLPLDNTFLRGMARAIGGLLLFMGLFFLVDQ